MNRIDRAAQYEHETGKEYLETKETLIPYHYTEWLEMKLSASDAAFAEAEEQHKKELDGSRDAFKWGLVDLDLERARLRKRLSVMSQACDHLKAELERLKADRENQKTVS